MVLNLVLAYQCNFYSNWQDSYEKMNPLEFGFVIILNTEKENDVQRKLRKMMAGVNVMVAFGFLFSFIFKFCSTIAQLFVTQFNA